MHRRLFLTSTTATLVSASLQPVRRALAQSPAQRLAMPPLLDTRATGRLSLTAMAGNNAFGGGPATATAGFNQTYLGPTILMQNGELAAEVRNTLNEPISIHWHGLLVPGEHDGGPHLPIATGATWQPAMTIAQDPGDRLVSLAYP